MRFFTPAVFAAAALGLAVANRSGSSTTWYLPFEAVIPSLAGDYPRQGNLTLALFGTLALFTGFRAWRTTPGE